jgi:sugar phosphate isomerase/epimerase
MDKWATGIFTSVDEGLGAGLDSVKELGVSTVHLHAPGSELRSKEKTAEIKEQFAESEIEISVVFLGFPDDDYSTTDVVKQTVGLVPKDRRERRLAETLDISGFAHGLGVDAIGMHLGFVPQDPTDPDFSAVVEVTRKVCDRCLEFGQHFHLETGQETASELLTFIDAVDRKNIAVNFDPANMILYGAGEPLAALDLVGRHVRSVHCKDAAKKRQAGQPWYEDAPLGEGDVDIRGFLLKLHDLGYEGPLTIEREFSPNQVGDIKKALQLLEDLRKEIRG